MNKKRYAGLLYTNPTHYDKIDSKGIEVSTVFILISFLLLLFPWLCSSFLLLLSLQLCLCVYAPLWIFSSSSFLPLLSLHLCFFKCFSFCRFLSSFRCSRLWQYLFVPPFSLSLVVIECIVSVVYLFLYMLGVRCFVYSYKPWSSPLNPSPSSTSLELLAGLWLCILFGIPLGDFFLCSSDFFPFIYSCT